MKIIQCYLAMERRAENLPFTINDLLEEGYQPHGNVFQDEDNYYCILMVKYEENK